MAPQYDGWQQVLSSIRATLEESLGGGDDDRLLGCMLDAFSSAEVGPAMEWCRSQSLAGLDMAAGARQLHAIRDRILAELGPDAAEPRVALRQFADELLVALLDDRRRRRLAEARRESLELIRISSHLSEVVYSRSTDGRLQTVSETVERLCGIPAEELLSAGGKWSEQIHDEDRPVYEAERARRQEEGTPGQVQYRVRNARDGGHHTVLDRGFPVFDDEGELDHVGGLLIDLTLQTARDASQARAERMQLLGQAAGGVAHSYNNILTVISGYSSALEDLEGLGAMEQRAIKQIVVASDRAADMTQRLIRYSVGDTPRNQSVHLLKLLKEARDLIRGMISKAVELKVLAQPDLPHVHGDACQLQEALLHLVANSREAMPRGGTLTLGMYMDKADPTGGQVVIEVRDTGEGMSSEVLDRIFDPYFTTRDREDAVGLGCSAAREIIESHGGTIHIDSAEGEGTRVVIRLPTIS